MEREELHRRIELLKNKLQEGKFHVAEHLADNFEKSLLKVRLKSDGIVDPDTVDGRIRSILNFVSYQNDRDEWKDAISLSEIQSKYFQGIDNCFGQPFEMMRKSNADPYQFSKWFSSDPQRVKETLPTLTEFVEKVYDFWDNISDPAWIHLEDSHNSKAVFGGELFPDAETNIASSTGIYFDTTILPDPFLKIAPLLRIWDDKLSCYNILRLGLQVLGYKNLALAEIPTPIIAILPDQQHLDEDYRGYVHFCATKDRLIHASRLFGREFVEDEELFNYLEHFQTVDSLVEQLKYPQELVFATEWKGDLASHITKYLKGEAANLNISTPGQAVSMQLWSRFAQANDFFQRSRSLNGTPIIKAETSWLWFNWMLRNNSNFSAQSNTKKLHIARAMNTTVTKEFSWLGNVPEKALIEIRKQGAMDEIKKILGTGISELINTNPNNFFRTGDKVFENLHNALLDHEKKIKELKSKKWKFAGRDLGSFIVVGGIEITAAITGLPLYGAIASTAGLTGVIPTAKELKEKISVLKEEKEKINNTGIGILMKHKKKV